MEFLVLFLFYLAVVLTSVVLLCVCSKTPRLQGLVRRGAQVFSCVIPECLQRAVQRLLRYLFHTRNYTFLVVHLAVQAMVYTEYTSEIFGYCQELEFPLYYLLQPYLLLAVNLVFFTLTCVTNPGTITKANESALLQVYEFDDVMFPKNARCSACDLRKPARSKHCRVCDCCVHRFDHHCVWVNNCIGAWNARYFLIYLATLAASAASVAAVSTTFLVHLVALSDLHQETYVDDRGHLQAVGVFFLVQDAANIHVQVPVPGLPEDRPAAGARGGAQHPPGRLPVLCAVPGRHQPDHLRVVPMGLGAAPTLPPCGPAPSLPQHSPPWAVQQPPGDISAGRPRL
ncbi:palmitoyltransferase ZDHHC4 isoform X2 [Oryctolagus cuniculus]|uniref:palmitoyltransferase ZDHHC4 isoform X2 n=1 Tax=Oryctolagus cuniculus TaxID=9986 RepID=UPI003879EE73